MEKKIIIASVVIAAVIIIAALSYIFIFSSTDPSRFIGTWKQSFDAFGFDSENATSETYWTFYDDGRLVQTDVSLSFDENAPIINLEENDENNYFTVSGLGPTIIQSGTYEIKGDKLYPNGIGDFTSNPSIGLNYKFINDDKFTLDFFMATITFNKITGDIPNPSYSFDDIYWSDINISLNAGFDEDVNWNNIRLSRSATPYSGEYCPQDWGKVQIGDKVEFGSYQSEHISGELNYIPTDTRIGWFSFWVIE